MEWLDLRQRCTPNKTRHTYHELMQQVLPNLTSRLQLKWIDQEFYASVQQQEEKKNVVLQLLHYILGTKLL